MVDTNEEGNRIGPPIILDERDIERIEEAVEEKYGHGLGKLYASVARRMVQDFEEIGGQPEEEGHPDPVAWRWRYPGYAPFRFWHYTTGYPELSRPEKAEVEPLYLSPGDRQDDDRLRDALVAAFEWGVDYSDGDLRRDRFYEVQRVAKKRADSILDRLHYLAEGDR